MTTTTGTVTLHRVLRAPAERIYRAFLDADALCKWLPPHGFTLWSVANKLFGSQLRFWRHVRIACAAVLVADAVQLLSYLTAFTFSLESLSRFAPVLMVLVLAGALYAHLATVLPRRRVGLAWAMAAVVLLGVPSWLGAQWLNRMRLGNELYMSSLFPPALRMAPAVPVGQFLQDADALRGKLDRRLRDDGLADEDDE